MIYGFTIYYLLLGTYSFNYECLQFLSVLEALIFLVNIGIYLALEEIFLVTKNPIYEKLAKN